MYELKIEVEDTLTPSSCSKLVIKMIKHILYNSRQIPVNYELLSGFMKRGKWHFDSREEENEVGFPVSSYKKMLIENFFNNVLCVFNSFEDTFRNLELEFLECGGVKEIIVMIGSTVLMPKKVFRIEIPVLQDCCCIKERSLQNNLTSVFRSMINSEDLHSYFKDNLEPMNVFILMKTVPIDQTKCKWFLPKDNFRIPNVKQLVIKLKQPENSDCECPCANKHLLQDIIDEKCSMESEVSDLDNSYICWYQTKLSLKGFRDQKIDGISAFNFLKCTSVLK